MRLAAGATALASVLLAGAAACAAEAGAHDHAAAAAAHEREREHATRLSAPEVGSAMRAEARRAGHRVKYSKQDRHRAAQAAEDERAFNEIDHARGQGPARVRPSSPRAGEDGGDGGDSEHARGLRFYDKAPPPPNTYTAPDSGEGNGDGDGEYEVSGDADADTCGSLPAEHENAYSVSDADVVEDGVEPLTYIRGDTRQDDNTTSRLIVPVNMALDEVRYMCVRATGAKARARLAHAHAPVGTHKHIQTQHTQYTHAPLCVAVPARPRASCVSSSDGSRFDARAHTRTHTCLFQCAPLRRNDEGASMCAKNRAGEHECTDIKQATSGQYYTVKKKVTRPSANVAEDLLRYEEAATASLSVSSVLSAERCESSR